MDQLDWESLEIRQTNLAYFVGSEACEMLHLRNPRILRWYVIMRVPFQVSD